MKFCKYCGAQLEDDQVCSCQQAAQPIAQPVAPAPAKNNVFTDTIGKVVEFVKSPLNAVKSAADKNMYGAAGILSGLLFVTVLFYFLISAIDRVVDLNSGLGYVAKIYGYRINVILIFVAALLTTILSAAIYIVATAVIRAIFVKDIPVGDMFGKAFIEFSLYSLPLSVAFILAALLSLASGTLGLIVLSLGVIFFLVFIITSVADKAEGISSNFLKVAALVGIIALFVIAGHYLFSDMHSWVISEPISSAVQDYIGKLF